MGVFHKVTDFILFLHISYLKIQ